MISPKSLLLAAVAATALALPSTAAAVPTPGAPTITSKPKGITNAQQAHIAWTAGSGATPASYECRTVVNNTPETNWQACESPVDLNSYKDQKMVLLVRGVGSNGLKGAMSTVTWKAQDLSFDNLGGIWTSAENPLTSEPHPGTLLRAGAVSVSGSSGKGAVTYAWSRCTGSFAWDCTNIDGANKAYYQPTKDDVGYRIGLFVWYYSDTDYPENSFVSAAGLYSQPTAVVTAEQSSAPALSWTGGLGFGKLISYSTGVFKGGFTACQPTVTGCSAEVHTTLEYCSTTSASSCVESYSLRNADAAFGANVFPNQRGTFRLVEGMAVGNHLRLHVHLSYVNGSATSDFYSPISTATVAGPETTANPTISGTAKVGSQMNSTLGTWINSYIYTDASLYNFYYARPYVDWYRCTSATDTSTCSPAHRYETAHWWEMVGAWSGWRAYTGYRPTSGDVGYYMRTKATMDLWWPLSSIHSGDMDSYESGFGGASAKVVS